MTDDMESTIEQTIADTLRRIETSIRVGNKQTLDFEEACFYTGYSEGHMYRLTSERRIPFCKRDRKIYFNKTELDRWMTQNRIETEEEIKSRATTYVATHR